MSVKSSRRSKKRTRKLDDDSDVGQLGILQERLLSLDEGNFEETRDWIISSIFCMSVDGIHDLIYTFYLIEPARKLDHKSSIFSRMITSLFSFKDKNEFISQISSQSEELLTVTKDLDCEELVLKLVECSIISQPKYLEIKNRESTFRRYYDRESIISNSKEKLYSESVEELKKRRSIFPHFDDENEKYWLYHLIKNDNLEELQDFLCEEELPDIDFRKRRHFNDDRYKFTMLDYAIFCGSIRCFKFLLMSNAKITDRSVKYAFMSGNIEIIRIIEQNNIDLSEGLFYAAQYFHNDIFDWLVETKGVDVSKLEYSDNVHVFKKLPKTKCIDESFFFNTQTIILTKYILTKCKRANNVIRMTFFKACIDGNVGLVKFLYQNFKLQYNNFYLGKLNALHVSIIENRIEVIEYLLNLKVFKFKPKKFYVFPAAIINKSVEVLKMLIDTNELEFEC